MKKIVAANWKRWAISTLITFLAGFAVAILPTINDITLASVQDGTVVGVFFIATRSGFKALLEAFVAWYAKK